MLWNFVDYEFIGNEELGIGLIRSSKVMESSCIFEGVVSSLKQLVNLHDAQLARFAELQKTKDALYISRGSLGLIAGFRYEILKVGIRSWLSGG